MMHKNRPKISLNPEPIDKVIDVIGFIAIGLMVIITIISFFIKNFAEQKETHGVAVWLISLIGLFIYVGLSIFKNHPHLFNYPNKITANNAEYQYKNGARFIRVLNTLSGILFASVAYTMAADEFSYGIITNTSIPVIITLLIVIVSTYFICKLFAKDRQ